MFFECSSSYFFRLVTFGVFGLFFFSLFIGGTTFGSFSCGWNVSKGVAFICIMSAKLVSCFIAACLFKGGLFLNALAGGFLYTLGVLFFCSTSGGLANSLLWEGLP